ncbi:MULTISPECIES: hypothetical protein [unclassified Pseudomonas]|uniref:hypothetical protein n=1 Tax=unclassified Pseudomonas TaxID=196821 RepID=UPI00117B1A05|nr:MULTISPECIES: hypothetical protein [unclassified Pseudomonas]
MDNLIGVQGVCLAGCGVFEIERRPRGASRINPLLHLLQRTEPVTPWSPALAHVFSLADKADNHGLSGVATLQQM